jgi:LPPG:FO 2-phospho-L-lactate transferase
MKDPILITLLAGGTGSVKLARGLHSVAKDLTVVCNVGDNIWLHSLYICPDIDTIVYGLANMLDTSRGWGVKHDTFEFLKTLELLGGESWFRIGDRDLAMHLVRTQMLKNGMSLSNFTEWVCKRLGIAARIVPSTENHLETRVLTDSGEMHLQEFWVKHGARMRVMDVVYSGANRARPTVSTLDALKSSSTVIIAPANPVSSIGPMLAMKPMKDALAKVRNKCMAISPVIGKEPVSGPAAKYMEALGIEVSPYGVAKFYSGIISRFIIHSSDKEYAGRIEDLGIKVHYANIMMKDKNDESRLASQILALQKSVQH